MVLLTPLKRVLVECKPYRIQNGVHVVQIFEAVGVIIKYNYNGSVEESNMFEDWCIK